MRVVLLQASHFTWLRQINIVAIIFTSQLWHTFLNGFRALLIMCQLFLKSPLLIAYHILHTDYLPPYLADIVL
jgi:hypothetical protein